MKEIELKILELPKNIFLKKMREIGAIKIHSVFVRVKYFDFPDGSIHKKHDLLRVREFEYLPEGKRKTEVVYKIFDCIKDKCKIYDEIEFELLGERGFAAACDFLKQLGFVETLHYEKKRTLFAFGKTKFEYDEHPSIPPFLEIEAPGAKEIHATVKKLGLEKYEQTSDSIGKLLERKYPKVKLNGLVF